MATRNERKRKAKARKQAILFELAKADTAARVQAIVRKNLAGGMKKDRDVGFTSSVTLVMQGGKSNGKGIPNWGFNAADKRRIERAKRG